MDKIAVADRPIPLSLLNSGRRASAEAKRRVLPFRIRDSEDRETKSPGILPSALNYTVLNGSIDGEDLDELGDKLSWYESIMRQLQEILGAELDDPDITYHEESNKIVERAKRMIEYREMIPAYEVRSFSGGFSILKYIRFFSYSKRSTNCRRRTRSYFGRRMPYGRVSKRTSTLVLTHNPLRGTLPQHGFSPHLTSPTLVLTFPATPFEGRTVGNFY